MNWKLLPLGLCVWFVLGWDDGTRAETTPEPGAGSQGVASISPKEAEPRQAVSLTLKGVTKGLKATVVLLDGSETSVGSMTIPENLTITFNIPATLPWGTYRVGVEVAGAYFISDPIDVVRRVGFKATLVKIDPEVLYAPEEKIDLSLVGTGFVLWPSGGNTVLFNGDALPVVILTARDLVSDRIEGLKAGADDYIVKPFDLDEVNARLEAVSRRYFGKAAPILQIGPVELEWEPKVARLDGRSVELSAREWAVVEVLGRRRRSIVSKEQIEDALYAFGEEIESNTIEVYVSRVRRKLGRDFIRTVRGLGYRLGE